MDPKACLDRLLAAIAANERDEVVQASSDLLCWSLADLRHPATHGMDGAELRHVLERIRLGMAAIADQLEPI